MKLCFVTAPASSTTEENSITLGVLCLLSQLKQYHECHLIDMSVLRKRRTIDNIENLLNTCVSEIVSLDPTLVGFSCMCSSFPIVVQTAQRLKRLLPHTHIVFGGPHCTGLENEILNAFEFVDSVVIGEADRTILELVRWLESGKKYCPPLQGVSIRGISQQTKSFFNTPVELDSLPIPLYECLLPSEYPELNSMRIDLPIPIDAGRGCAAKCSFCATRSTWGMPRQKSPERLLVEMDSLHHRFSKNYFAFTHDSFILNRQNTEHLLKVFINARHSYTWGCSVRADLLDEKLIEEFHMAGCRGMFFGLETGSPNVKKAIGKVIDNTKLLNVVKYCLSHGIDIITSFIIGFPFETEADLQMTLDLHKRMVDLGVRNSMVNMLCPLPASRLFREGYDIIYDGFPPNLSSLDDINLQVQTLIQEHPNLFSSFFKYMPRHISLLELSIVQVIANNYCSVTRKFVPLRLKAQTNFNQLV